MVHTGSRPPTVIGADTSVLVRYLVGTPVAQAKRAAMLIDGKDDIGVSPVGLAECAHVLRTQYAVEQADIIDSLIGLVQRATLHARRYVRPRCDAIRRTDFANAPSGRQLRQHLTNQTKPVNLRAWLR
jgi:predicted nucleic acid-binding protein